MNPNHRLIPLSLVAAAVIGCSSSDERLSQLAQEMAHEQASQNHRMAQLQQEVAAGARQLVEAEGRARQEFFKLQAQLQSQTIDVGRQRDELELQRQQLDLQRRREPLIASAVLQAGLLIACLAPLLLCGQLLRSANQETADELVVELLVRELASNEPRLLAPPETAQQLPAIEAPNS